MALAKLESLNLVLKLRQREVLMRTTLVLGSLSTFNVRCGETRKPLTLQARRSPPSDGVVEVFHKRFYGPRVFGRAGT